MIAAISELLLAVPAITLATVMLAAWLLRRRPGRLRHAWLLGFVGLFVAADAEPLPLPDPEPDPEAALWGTATPARHTVEMGLGGGSYQTCSGARRYGDLGAMYRYSTPIGERTNLEVRAGGYGAWDGAVTGGVRASVGVEHRWVGARVGGVVGALAIQGSEGAPVLPAAALRVGPRDMFFLDAALFDVSPAPLPGALAAGGIGIAFPKLGNAWEPLVVRAGVSGSGVYLAPSIPLGDFGNLELTGAYGDTNTWGATGVLRLHFAAAPPPE